MKRKRKGSPCERRFFLPTKMGFMRVEGTGTRGFAGVRFCWFVATIG